MMKSGLKAFIVSRLNSLTPPMSTYSPPLNFARYDGRFFLGSASFALTPRASRVSSEP